MKLFVIFVAVLFSVINISNASIVGVLADYYQLEEDSCDGCNSGTVFAMHEYYVNALIEACRKHNVSVVLIPFSSQSLNYVQFLDGIVIPDNRYAVHPRLYNEHPIDSLHLDPQATRQDFEINIIKQFVDNDRSVLAINRGMQMLNITYGGTLMQDILKSQTSVKHQMSENMTHDITLQKGTKLYKILTKESNSEKISVNSMHTDAIKKLGVNLTVSAYSKDNMIEAIEDSGKKFVIGVQWDPEYLRTSEDAVLFDNFCQSVSIKSQKKT